MKFTRFLSGLAALALVLGMADHALACAICYGEPGNPLTEGVSAGVLVLLGVIVAVLGWFVAFIIYFGRRARQNRALEGEFLQERPGGLQA